MPKNGFTSPIRIGLVQINNSFSGQNYMPYSVGLLQAYAQKYARFPEQYEFLQPIYCRKSLQEMVDHLAEADIVGFSTYVWNNNVSIETARRLKEVNPDVLIVFGGPQVPDNAERFLGRYNFIDIACHGEGEQVFLSIIENYRDKAWERVPSISYIDGNGRFINQKKVTRIKDLADVPSPYLSGVFDSLIAANPNEVWLILWETNRGCPFSCTFCDWGSATAAKVYRFDQERLFKEIEWFAAHQIEFVFCCDANFGILPRDVEIAEFIADVKARTGYPHALSVQNTKNATERAYKVQKILADARLNKGVTISLQSIDPNTLESIKRQNISSDSFQELQRRFTRDKVETYTDVILGLPGETYDTFVGGVSAIIESGQHNRIQFNNLSILPNSEMGDPDYQKQYGMEVVQSQIFNIHGSLNDLEEEVHEIQDLVIATRAMPKDDWIRARAFSWMTGFLHFDKVLQMPLIIVHEVCGIDYREFIETFLDAQPEQYPTLAQVANFFSDKARDIQNGGFEYCLSREWLNIGWPADEFMLIQLCVTDSLESFYREAERCLMQLLAEKHFVLPPDLLHQTIQLNMALLKRPFQHGDLEYKASYNLWEFYQSVLVGESITIEQDECVYRIERSSEVHETWEDWLREVIWYGNKKGAYLYGNEQVGRQLAGHY